jgi:hypothetical protein
VLFLVAKVVQLIGMATVAFGLYLGLTSDQAMVDELRLLLSGALIFLAGWLLQRRSQR